MKKFSELGIKPTTSGFVGDKIKINRIVNKEIKVLDYKIEDSKFNNDNANKKCLHLQIEISGTKHVVFTGSFSLMDLIKQVPQTAFPFQTTIVKNESERFEFS